MPEPPRRPPAGPPDLEIPDLDLDPRARAHRQQPGRSRARPAEPASSERSAEPYGLDDFDSFRPGVAIPSPSSVQSEGLAVGELGGADEFDSFTEGTALELGYTTPIHHGVERQDLGRRLPTGKTPGAETLDIDPAEVAVAADYGPVPENWFSAPPYTWRVLVRRRKLEQTIGRLSRALRQAEEARDESLARTLQDNRAQLEADERSRRVIADALAAEGLIQERTEAMARADAERSAHESEFERQRNEIGRSLADRRQARDEFERLFQARDQDFKRAQARLKRVAIELRNAQALASQGEAPSRSPELLTSEQVAQETELKEKRQEAERVGALLRTARGEVERLERQLERLEQRQRSTQQKSKRELGERGGSVEQARAQARRAWADAARGLIASGDSGWLDDSSLASLQLNDDAVASCARELEKHVRALDVYHREAVAIGYRVVLLGVAALVAVVVAARLL